MNDWGQIDLVLLVYVHYCSSFGAWLIAVPAMVRLVINSLLMAELSWAHWTARLATALLKVMMESSFVAKSWHMLQFPKSIGNILVLSNLWTKCFKHELINIVSVVLVVAVMRFIWKTPVLVMSFNAFMMTSSESYPWFAWRAKVWPSLTCLKSISIGLVGSKESWWCH